MNSTTEVTVRPLSRDDLEEVAYIVEATDMFPGSMLDGMVANYFESESTDDRWLVVSTGKVQAVAYFVAERLTAGTWNLLLIAVSPQEQRKGIGARLLAAVESELAQEGNRLLIVETSGLASFESTRNFYLRQGYTQEARIRDFYEDGNDKVTFAKRLTS